MLRFTIQVLVFCITALVVFPAGAQLAVEGLLLAQWGDPPPDSGQPGSMSFELNQADGARMRLNISEDILRSAGGVLALDGKRVTVEVAPARLHSETEGRRVIRILKSDGVLAPGQGMIQRNAVPETKSFVTLPCKFADDPSTPKDQDYFNDLYGNNPGELNHYWKAESYNNINIDGSQSQDWLVLPNDRSDYIPVEGGCFSTPANLDKLFDECIAKHDPSVNFSGYFGINLAFNDTLDGCAWGGGRWATLDGVTRIWGVTWLPPWGYNNSDVLAHENGHAFGLPHSNNWDGDGNPYDNRWDYMSGGSGYNSTYGNWGTGGMAHHKDMLGWLAPAEILEVAGGVHTVDLDPLGAPATSALRMIKLPVDANTFWTVEAREKTGDYEKGIPDTAVLISEVKNGRSEPVWVYDKSDPPAPSNNNEGTMWKVGETFADTTNNITVEILQAIASGGFEVRITRPSICSPDLLELSNDTVTTTESHEACEINAGSNFEVMGPGGDLTLTANIVRLQSGFNVSYGGTLTVSN